MIDQIEVSENRTTDQDEKMINNVQGNNNTGKDDI